MGRILAQLQKDSKAADSRLSDEVESFMLEVKWEPVNGALAVDVPEVLLQLPAQELAIVRRANAFCWIFSDLVYLRTQMT